MAKQDLEIKKKAWVFAHKLITIAKSGPEKVFPNSSKPTSSFSPIRITLLIPTVLA